MPLAVPVSLNAQRTSDAQTGVRGTAMTIDRQPTEAPEAHSRERPRNEYLKMEIAQRKKSSTQDVGWIKKRQS